MEQVKQETIKMEETRKQPSRLKGPGGAPLSEVIGAVITEAAQPPSGAQPVQRVTTKNLKKVEAGKRLAESNRKKREVKKREQAKLEASGVNQYYGIGAVLALGVIGVLGYYIYRTKKGEQPKQNNPKPQPLTQPQTNKFEMDKIFSIL